MSDPSPADRLVVPPGWEVVDRPAAGVALVALEPERAPAAGDRAPFRSNLVVTAVPTGGLDFRDWQAGSDEILDRALTDYLLVDLERLQIDGLPGGRRLAHHTGPHDEALTLEQWFVLHEGIGHTLTATVETARYDELADVTATAAGTWRPALPRGADAR
ncbi:hypothetical protein [Nocardioides aquiterrae]|uniref:Uncharacterized protein n=1 Tax=Nocardioides aquiterrae TaxID=203799 RepID=A0ABN1UBJ5_9ACTN